MNLFVAGWNYPREERCLALETLRAMHATYPLLDPETVGHWECERGFAAWFQPARAAAGPRSYVYSTPGELVLFDGTPVDPSGRIAAYDAAALASHWSHLTGHLEGRYVAVRIKPDTFEVLNDPYGTHHTFVHQRGPTLWTSNSARLLARVTSSTTIDLEGMAQCIGMYFPMGTRTLVRGISVVPAAQHWLSKGDAPPHHTTYAPASDLAELDKRPFGAREAESLASEMIAPLRVLADTLGPLECPITAGRDSRMLTGLMVAGGVPGDYFSVGESEGIDARMGAAIAQRLGLPHRNPGGSKHDLAASWDEISVRVVRQHDGTVTLAHAENALIRPERLCGIPVELYGAAGELARGVRFTPRFILQRPTHGQARTLARNTFDRSNGLLRAEAQEALRGDIDKACRDLQDQGFAAIDIPDAFDLTEYGRRWAGAQARQMLDHKDTFMPFLTRSYMRAAFATPARERFMERVPFQLLKHLSPVLLEMPLQKPWPAQRFGRLLLERALAVPRLRVRRFARGLRRHRHVPAGRKRERLFVLERQLPRWRERFLDRDRSSLWDVVDRNRFEYLTSNRVTQPELSRHQAILYQAVTAFTFDEDFEQWMHGR
jgi:asparagine synthase (glutamine-hydrolysing)